MPFEDFMKQEYNSILNDGANNILDNKNLSNSYKKIKTLTKYSKPSQILDTSSGPILGKFNSTLIGKTLTKKDEIEDEI